MKVVDYNTYDLTYNVRDDADRYHVIYRWLSNGCYKVLKRDNRGDYWPYTGPKVGAIIAAVVSFNS